MHFLLQIPLSQVLNSYIRDIVLSNLKLICLYYPSNATPTTQDIEMYIVILAQFYRTWIQKRTTLHLRMKHLLLFSHTLTIQLTPTMQGYQTIQVTICITEKLNQKNKHDSSIHYFIVGFYS